MKFPNCDFVEWEEEKLKSSAPAGTRIIKANCSS